jgi:hypothetical protein
MTRVRFSPLRQPGVTLYVDGIPTFVRARAPMWRAA